MRPFSRSLRWIALFLIVDSGVYMATAREWTGGPLIAATAGAFTYVALVVAGAVRQATKEVQAEGGGEMGAVELEHVGPSIWPAGFALASIMLAIGAAVVRLLLIPGGILFVASALGWATDVRRQHAAHDQGAHHGAGEPVIPGSETPAP